MDLVTLRARCGSILDYDPENDTYSAQTTEFINAALLEIAGSRPWPWAEVATEITAHGDVTATDGGVVNGDTHVTTVTPFFESWMEGCILDIDGVEYTVARVASAVSAYLTKSYAGATASDVAFAAIERFLWLPEDCVEVRHVGPRRVSGSSDIEGYAREEADWWRLDLDEVGTPGGWLLADSFNIAKPRFAPSLTTTTGSWPDGTYTFGLTYSFAGRHSAMGPTASITLTGGTQAPQLTLPALPTGLGYDRSLWITYSPFTAYRLHSDGYDEAGGTFTLSSSPLDSMETATRLYEAEGQHSRIMLYPRQDADTTIAIRYIRRAPRLIEDYDVPIIPSQYHELLVALSVAGLALKHDNPAEAAIQRRRADTLLLQMANRYFPEAPTRIIRGDSWARLGLPVTRYSAVTWSG